MRVACVLVPDLALRAELRARPELRAKPFVVASGAEGRAQVIAASPQAERLGILPGRGIAHARAVCAGLQVCVASPALEHSARTALLDAALSLSPRATLAPLCGGAFAAEAAAWVDASGVASLHGSEQGFASKLGVRCEALGLPAVILVAGSRNTALWIARGLAARRNPDEREQSAFRVLSPASEARVLAPLPLDLLEPDDALAERLTRFGIRTVRDLLALPKEQLHHRLGASALALYERARGNEPELSLPEPEVSTISEAIDLEFPLNRLEPMRFALRGLLARVVQRLEVRGLACAGFDLELGLCGGGRDARRIGVAAATTDLRVLLRLVSLALETRPPQAEVETLCLRARGTALRCDQLDLFLPAGPDPQALDQTLAELESLCGTGRVGAPAVANDHRPGAFALVPFLGERQARERAAGSRSSTKHTPEASASRANAPKASAPQPSAGLAARALRPPAAAEVRIEAGRPAWLRSAVASGHIVHLSGPWRTTGRWWSEEERYALDHYDIAVSDGSVLRLCFDWTRKHWCIDALYD